MIFHTSFKNITHFLNCKVHIFWAKIDFLNNKSAIYPLIGKLESSTSDNEAKIVRRKCIEERNISIKLIK